MKITVPENMSLNACKVRISGISITLESALTFFFAWIELGKQSRFRLITKESDLPSDSEVCIITLCMEDMAIDSFLVDCVPRFQNLFDPYHAQCCSSPLAGKMPTTSIWHDDADPVFVY